jgi:two-component system, NtrC family, response regulator HydG
VYYTYIDVSAVLVGTGGPCQGKLVPLGEAEVSIGRDGANSIPIDDLSASRRHCVIRPAGEGFQLTDLQSRNGTFVNGNPVRECLLEDNDEIRLGSSVFLFRLTDTLETDAGSVELDDSRVTHSVVLRRSDDSIYLDSHRLADALPGASQTARGLSVLLEISQALQGAQTLEALEQQLLELLLKAIPARCGAILLCSEDGAINSTFAWDRERGRNGAVRIPPDVSRQVLKERVTIAGSGGAGTGGGEGGEPSWELIAAPLTCFDRVEGLLYLETGHPAAQFEAADPDLVSAVGTIAGLGIHNLLRLENLRSENQRLQAEIRIEHDMIGESPAMQAIHQFIGRVSRTDSTVLIGGESGTGKELVARAIHRNSARSKGPFVAINCAALTESLLEDELFGHERGAFTGALGLKKGKIEVAEGGTLFLDEIGELAPALQAKLLRALQNREFERVGGTRTIKVDVRVIAATNRDLEAAVHSGNFRQDLYFRLNVIGIVMPPLRERREDVPLLASHFAANLSQKIKGKRSGGISERARRALVNYDWPGNVRELENAIERAVVLGSSDEILSEDLPEAILEAGAGTPSVEHGNYQDAIVEAKRRAVRDALDRAHGVYTEAAKLLDVHPNYLHRLVRSLRLR